MSAPIGPAGRRQARPSPKEPTGWRATGRRLLARLVPRFGEGIGTAEAAEFDAAAREAYQAALKLDTGSPRAPASPPSSPTDLPGPGPEPAAATDAPTWAAVPSPDLPSDRPNGPARAAADPVGAAPHRPQPGETAPSSLLRTPSNVTLVADEFFDSIIRHVESDR